MNDVLSFFTCHTNDRHNWNALMDNQCGVTSYSSNFRYAVDKIFNVTYWPYTQDPRTYRCIRRFFVDSYDSLIL